MIALDRVEHLKELKDKVALSSQHNLCLQQSCSLALSDPVFMLIGFISCPFRRRPSGLSLASGFWFQGKILFLKSLARLCGVAGVVGSWAWGTKTCPCLWHAVSWAVMYPRVTTPGDGTLLPENLIFLGVGKVRKSLGIWSGCNQMLRNKKWNNFT